MLYIIYALIPQFYSIITVVVFIYRESWQIKKKVKQKTNKQTAGDLILNENHELESIDEKLFCFFFLLFNPVYLIDVIWKRSLTSQDERGDVLTTRSPYKFPFISFSHVYVCRFFPRGILFLVFCLIAGLFYFVVSSFRQLSQHNQHKSLYKKLGALLSSQLFFGFFFVITATI